VVKIAGKKFALEKQEVKLTKPAQLRAGHIVSAFNCGEEVLNLWLQKRAFPAAAERTAVTFVVCRGKKVVGFYSLAASSISHSDCSSDLRRNSPDPVPAILLARLGVDISERGKGIGQDLVQDAALRVLRTAKNVAARTLIVHALNTKVAAFYKKLGFVELQTGRPPITMHLKLDKILAGLTASAR